MPASNPFASQQVTAGWSGQTPEQVRGDRVGALISKRTASQRGMGPPLTYAEERELENLSRDPGQPAWAAPKLPGAAAPPPAQESPYDPIYQSGNGVTTYLGPRYKLDIERQMGESALAKSRFDLEQAKQQAQQQMDMQRWMFEQMRNNPYGMNIRDLIYGAGQK